MCESALMTSHGLHSSCECYSPFLFGAEKSFALSFMKTAEKLKRNLRKKRPQIFDGRLLEDKNHSAGSCDARVLLFRGPTNKLKNN